MRYEDESKTASGLRDMKATGGREFLPIVIPEVKAAFVLLETLHKGGPIVHNVCHRRCHRLHGRRGGMTGRG